MVIPTGLGPVTYNYINLQKTKLKIYTLSNQLKIFYILLNNKLKYKYIQILNYLQERD
jgi:hypothetical protein